MIFIIGTKKHTSVIYLCAMLLPINQCKFGLYISVISIHWLQQLHLYLHVSYTVAVFIVIRSHSKNLYLSHFFVLRSFSLTIGCIIVYTLHMVFCPPCYGYGQETFTGFTIPPFFDRIRTTDFFAFLTCRMVLWSDFSFTCYPVSIATLASFCYLFGHHFLFYSAVDCTIWKC